MEYKIAFGRGHIHVNLPEKNVVKVFGIPNSSPLQEPENVVRELLEHPIQSPPLRILAEGKQSACIVVSDITRPVPNPILLHPILKVLSESGIVDSNILILVATGLHRASTPQEKKEMFGEEIITKYRIEDHDARNREEHDYLGESKNGVPIWIDRRYLEADLKILTGLIEPHFMAGFSGGRKSICPGLAASETIAVWHSPRFLEHENAKFGCVDGNPVHAEQMEIARKAGCDFIVNVVIDPLRRILNVVTGNMEAAHENGVQFARKHGTDSINEPVDVVVTSAAGYPLDKTWYQSVKGVLAALDILKPNGTIILISSCDEGLGSKEFETIAEKFATIDEFMTAILSDSFFIVNQWQLEELAKALKKGKVKVFTTGVPHETLRKYYVEPISDIESAIQTAFHEYGENMTIAILPDGPYILATLETGKN
ncbi:MAG: nickel-dependent lactate racemase [Thermoguttaceae bacterium]